MKRFSLTIESELYDKIKEAAKAANKPMTQFIRDILKVEAVFEEDVVGNPEYAQVTEILKQTKKQLIAVFDRISRKTTVPNETPQPLSWDDVPVIREEPNGVAQIKKLPPEIEEMDI